MVPFASFIQLSAAVAVASFTAVRRHRTRRETKLRESTPTFSDKFNVYLVIIMRQLETCLANAQVITVFLSEPQGGDAA